jgi:hypothetical protein
MSERITKKSRGSSKKLPTTIPPLHSFLYEECGYAVPPDFTVHYVILHGNDWRIAERDWEEIVALVLDTDAVERLASGGRAVRQAVEAAVEFLMEYELWPWCPICRRGTEVDEVGER